MTTNNGRLRPFTADQWRRAASLIRDDKEAADIAAFMTNPETVGIVIQPKLFALLYFVDQECTRQLDKLLSIFPADVGEKVAREADRLEAQGFRRQ